MPDTRVIPCPTPDLHAPFLGRRGGCSECGRLRMAERGRKHYEANRDLMIGRYREWRAANPERHKRNARNSHVLRKYGITIVEQETMIASQGGVCLICERLFTEDRKPCVDHRHDTGAVRGILCGGCNSAIGLMGEDPDILLRAVRYLGG